MYNDNIWIDSDVDKVEFPNWHAEAEGTEVLIPSAHRTAD